MTWLATGLRRRGRDLAYLLGEGARSAVSLAGVLAALCCLPLLTLGVGWLPVPRAVAALDGWAGAALRRAGVFAGVPVRVERRDLTGPFSAGGRMDLLTARETRRQGLWLLADSLAPFLGAALALGLVLSPLTNIVLPLFWWAFPPGAPLETSFAVTSWPLALAAVAVGVAYVVVGWLLVPVLARAVARGTLALLGPRRGEELAERVEALSASRAAALDAHAAELRRIERDLHDGAQNRLVGVVMMLGLARRALDQDPASAAAFLDRAQDAAGDALAGLRAVVHDVYPPVLDELGLEGAASALTSRCPVPCALDTTGLRRAPAAVESAAYFVLAEALTNVARHSRATRAAVRLRTDTERDVLVVEVVDDGRGGARLGGADAAGAGDGRPGGPAGRGGADAGTGGTGGTGGSNGTGGTGLAGIARRVAAFDGALTLDSPPGGPTILRAELACGS